MKDLLQSLKDKQLVESEQHVLLTHNFVNMAQKLFQNQMIILEMKTKTVMMFVQPTDQAVCYDTALLLPKELWVCLQYSCPTTSLSS